MENIEDKKMLFVYYKNGERFAGNISENVYYNQIFNIFRDNLKPLDEKEIQDFKKKIGETKTIIANPKFKYSLKDIKITLFCALLSGLTFGTVIGMNLK